MVIIVYCLLQVRTDRPNISYDSQCALPFFTGIGDYPVFDPKHTKKKKREKTKSGQTPGSAAWCLPAQRLQMPSPLQSTTIPMHERPSKNALQQVTEKVAQGLKKCELLTQMHC